MIAAAAFVPGIGSESSLPSGPVLKRYVVAGLRVLEARGLGRASRGISTTAGGTWRARTRRARTT